MWLHSGEVKSCKVFETQHHYSQFGLDAASTVSKISKSKVIKNIFTYTHRATNNRAVQCY